MVRRGMPFRRLRNHRRRIGSTVAESGGMMFEGQIGKDLMIEQGYVPSTCTLDARIAGPLIYSMIKSGKSPCDGCNEDRSICGGSPKKED